jgi:hypothetical protein
VVPRGDAAGRIIDDGGPDGEVNIHIDDRELPLAQFGCMFGVHAGRGVRITFVPAAFATENPRVKVPERNKRVRSK